MTANAESSFRFGLLTNCLGQVTIDEAVEVAKTLGVDCIQVGPSVQRDLPAFKRVMADGEIAIHSFIYARNVITEDAVLRAEYRRETRRLLDMALLLGVPQIVMSAGMREDLTLEQNIDETLAFWGPLFEEGNAGGVRFALEFCPSTGTFALGPAAWRPLLDATRAYPNFGLNYDPSHLLWQFIDPYTPIADFSDAIFSVHAKDTHVDHSRLATHGIFTPYRYEEMAPHGVMEPRSPWWSVRIPGEGDLDWPRFFAELRRSGFNDAVIIEHEASEYMGSRERVLDGLHRSLDALQAAVVASESLMQEGI